MTEPNNTDIENSGQSGTEMPVELSLMQKISGIITEPVKTFAKIAEFPVKTIDWLLPVILVILFAILSNYSMMQIPEIKEQAINKQLDMYEQNFNQAVDEGRMTQEQAEQQLEVISSQIESQISAGIMLQAVSIIIIIFFMFFLISAVFFLIARFVFKDQGTYSSSLSAFGLSYYISIIQIVVLAIAVITSKSLMNGTSVRDFMEVDVMTWKGFILGKLDIFSIWFYSVVSIGYAKMFKSRNTLKYVITIFGLWIGFTLLIFLMAQSIPFLRNFVR